MYEAYISAVYLLRLFSTGDKVSNFRTRNVSLHGKLKLLCPEKTNMLRFLEGIEEEVSQVL